MYDCRVLTCGSSSCETGTAIAISPRASAPKLVGGTISGRWYTINSVELSVSPFFDRVLGFELAVRLSSLALAVLPERCWTWSCSKHRETRPPSASTPPAVFDAPSAANALVETKPLLRAYGHCQSSATAQKIEIKMALHKRWYQAMSPTAWSSRGTLRVRAGTGRSPRCAGCGSCAGIAAPMNAHMFRLNKRQRNA